MIKYNVITTLIVCKEHRTQIKKKSDFLAQGICDKHGRHVLYHKNLAVPCPKCAYVRGACQICGKLIEKDDLDEQGTPVPKGRSRVYQ
ncbi:MAG: hypothetical protein PHF86_10940 [Candidatus Nanoarchaeia archaeon]|jgi:phage FluMu protein Com|nr:hypothetical protein [Candidatus Nanoarchaeia archaeon]